MPPEDQLPDLDPMILMSASGRRELEAAQAAVAPFEGSYQISEAELHAAEQRLPDLYREMALAQERQLSASFEGFELGVDFAEEEVPNRGLPNERFRFQVGRESPPRHPVQQGVRSGPSDGEIVSRRRADGRFQPVRRLVGANQGLAEAYSSPRISPTSKAAEAPPPQKLAPTALERILGPDLFK